MVVEYRVAVPENQESTAGNTIVTAIKTQGGGWKFGEFEMDGNYTSAQSKLVL